MLAAVWIIYLFPLLLVSTHADPIRDPLHFVTPTGTLIPLHRIRAALHPSLSNSSSPGDHVFEVDAEGMIHGPRNFKLSINQLLSRHITPQSDFKVTVNGRPWSHPNNVPIGTVRSDGNIHAVYTSSNQLVAVWARQLKLRPVDANEHKHVFVNDYVTSDNDAKLQHEERSFSEDDLLQEKDTDGDIRPLSRQANCAAGLQHYFEVATVIDSTLCAAYGNYPSIALTALHGAFAIANEPYKATCVQFVIKSAELHCNGASSDPYSYIADVSRRPSGTTAAGYILNQFSQYWYRNRNDVKRDAAHLFTAFQDGTGVLGIAHLPGTCTKRTSYSWMENFDPFVIAHEGGHNLGLPHATSGLMKPSVDRKSYFLSSTSIATLTAYLDGNPQSACVDGKAPTCDASCDGYCIGGVCTRRGSPGPGLVACSLVAATAICGTTITAEGFLLTRATTCPASYKFVERVWNADDPNIFCCRETASSVTTLLGIRPKSSVTSVRLPSGNLARNIIWPRNSVLRGRLMQTDIVEGCSLASRTPVATPRPSPPPSSSTCGSAFTENLHLSCRRLKKETITVSTIGQVRLIPSIGFGIFRVKVVAPRKALISELGIHIDTNPSLAASVADASSRVYSTRIVTISSGKIGDMSLLAGKSSCCGTGAAKAYIVLKLCKGANCKKEYHNVKMDISCKQVCSRNSKRFKGIPMSESTGCPKCERK